MQFRTLGKTGFKPSALGFGCMRLPTEGEKKDVDEPLAIEMLRSAIDAGVNYLDTAYPYHGGQSERVIAKALKDGYRDKVVVADKMPIWEVKEHGDFDRHEEEWERERDRYFQMRDDLVRQLAILDDEAHVHHYDKKHYSSTHYYEDAVWTIIENWKAGDDL